MSFLLIYKSDETPFEPFPFKKLLESSDQTSQISESAMPGALISAHFSSRSDSVIVELKEDKLAIVISSPSPAGLDFALLLQMNTFEPLRIVDEAYTFDLNLQDYQSADALDAAIKSTLVD